MTNVVAARCVMCGEKRACYGGNAWRPCDALCHVRGASCEVQGAPYICHSVLQGRYPHSCTPLLEKGMKNVDHRVWGPAVHPMCSLLVGSWVPCLTCTFCHLKKVPCWADRTAINQWHVLQEACK